MGARSIPRDTLHDRTAPDPLDDRVDLWDEDEEDEDPDSPDDRFTWLDEDDEEDDEQ